LVLGRLTHYWSVQGVWGDVASVIAYQFIVRSSLWSLMCSVYYRMYTYVTGSAKKCNENKKHLASAITVDDIIVNAKDQMKIQK